MSAKALITRKVGVTSIIAENGDVQAVTVLSATANTITQVKSVESDGYNSVQLGFEDDKKAGKAILGHLKPAKASSKVIREFRVEEHDDETKVGNQVKADVFNVGDTVHVTGTSKGKGFAGTIKRHNFARGRKTHGGRSYRRPGSIGSMYPQKIFKGKKMAGQMGGERVTTKNLKVAYVNVDKNLIGIAGTVPGPRKGVVLIKGVK